MYSPEPGNVQKDAGKKERLYNFCKVRLALRYCWAAALHTLCPKRMVEEGLMDPAVDFIKAEGHPPRKIKTSSWRLIWNISEVDRLLDNLCFVDQDHHDVYSFQDGPRCEGDKLVGAPGTMFPMAAGVGHDDQPSEDLRRIGGAACGIS